jgi:hypothetical protein
MKKKKRMQSVLMWSDSQDVPEQERTGVRTILCFHCYRSGSRKREDAYACAQGGGETNPII